VAHSRTIQADEKARLSIKRFEEGLRSQEVAYMAAALDDLCSYIQSQVPLYIEEAPKIDHEHPELKDDPSYAEGQELIRALMIAVAHGTQAYKAFDNLVSQLDRKAEAAGNGSSKDTSIDKIDGRAG
jgi:hypothetical protein